MSVSRKPKTVYIVGAGFSFHAGLPLATDFTKALLEAREFKTGPSRLIIEYLSQFIRDAFDRGLNAGSNLWPDLEDLFTCVDLAANAGHHLGERFSPAELRSIRRALLSRIVRMLSKKYLDGRKAKGDQKSIALETFFGSLDLRRSSFISLNWDTVIEQKMGAAHPNWAVDYGCDAIASVMKERPHRDDYPPKVFHRLDRESCFVQPVRLVGKKHPPSIPVVKIHGSINWLYCDNCRRLYSFDPSSYNQIANQLLTELDLKRIADTLGPDRAHKIAPSLTRDNSRRFRCGCVSNGVELSTRIATFSYRKALDFPMFQKSWFAAERLLQDADRWVFIGYSLPKADFEFKYFLKRIQLARKDKPRIVLVTGGQVRAVKETTQNFKRFFGRGLEDSDVHKNGLIGFIP